jgi:hypothetical protein
MLFLVQVRASMDRANTIDAGEGPGATFAKIAQRFRPQQFWGTPTRREATMVVDLETPKDVAELMYVLTWFSGTEPTFTPLIKPEIYDEASAAAKRIVTPPK